MLQLKNKIIFTNKYMMDRTIKQQMKEYKLQLLREKKEINIFNVCILSIFFLSNKKPYYHI